MTEILEELHRYVPEDGNKLLKVLILLLGAGVRVVQCVTKVSYMYMYYNYMYFTELQPIT